MKTIVINKRDIYYGFLILVNNNYQLKGKNTPQHLECVYDKYPTILLENHTIKKLQTILKEINAQDKIVPVSGYRSLEEQTSIYRTSLKDNGKTFTQKYVALPQASEHQTGLAIDLGLKQENIDFLRPAFPHTGICEKFREIAYRYGFIERYKEDKQEITKIASEEWHFRYVGYPHSQIMKEQNLCLEEYHEMLKHYPYPNSPLRYQEYEIYYLPFQHENQAVTLEDKDMISGNNIDGFIITRKK